MPRSVLPHLVYRTAPASGRLVERAVAAGLRTPVESVLAGGAFALSPVLKPVALAVAVAASVVGLVGLFPTKAPDAPPKDQPKVEEVKTADGFPLPTGAVHRFGNRQARHADGIRSVIASPDGRYLATLGNTTVVIWDAKTLTAKCVLHNQMVPAYSGDTGNRVTFFPDSKSLLIAVQPQPIPVITDRAITVGIARVFDVETGKERFELRGDMDYGTAAWIAAGGKEIAAYSSQAVRYYDPKNGVELRKVACGPELVGIPCVAPEANLMALRRNDNNTLKVVNTQTGQGYDELTVENLGQLALTPDGKRMAYSDGTGKIHIYDLKEKKELFSFGQPAGNGVVTMRFSADQQTLYFGGQHGRLYRWDLKNNQKLPDVGQHSSWNLSALALSPDESILYSTGYDHLIRRWDLKTLKQLPLPDGYITQTATIPLPDRKTLLIADHQGAIDLWDLATGKLIKRLQGQNAGGIDCVAVSADGRWFAGGKTGQDVTLWDLAAGKLERIIPLVEKPDAKGSDHVKRVAFDAAGKVLFTASGKTGVTAWEVPTGKQLWRTPATGTWMAVDPRGRWVAIGGGYNREQVQWTLLSATTGEVVRRVDVAPLEMKADAVQFINYPPYLTDVAFTPDGSRVVTGHYDNTVRVWDPEAGREVGRLTGTGYGQVSLTVSADGRWVGVGQSDKKITVWELATGEKVVELDGHDSLVRDVAFTKDGRGIIGNADLAPVLWSLDPKDANTFDGPVPPWDMLSSYAAAKAYRVQWALIKNPAAAVKLFGEKVKPAELALERSKFDKWIADLDSPQFRAREAAERELLKAGVRVPLGWLRTALANSKADEQRARLTRVLAEREKPNPDERRLGRAVQILELAGTDDARALLKSWAAVEGSPVTEAAREALARLAGR
jgi:WD40 repeat protein